MSSRSSPRASARRAQLVADRAQRSARLPRARHRTLAGVVINMGAGLDRIRRRCRARQSLDAYIANRRCGAKYDQRLHASVESIKSADRRSPATPPRDPGRRPAAGRAGCGRADRAAARDSCCSRAGIEAAQHGLDRRRPRWASARDGARRARSGPWPRAAGSPSRRRRPGARPRRGSAATMSWKKLSGRRRQHVVAVGERRVAAVAGEQELEQVVAADRQEVDPLQQRLSCQ